jgi:hypothetical protein
VTPAEPGLPCSYCGVNSHTPCRHRLIDTGPAPEALEAVTRVRKRRMASVNGGKAGKRIFPGRKKLPYPGTRKGWGFEPV